MDWKTYRAILPYPAYIKRKHPKPLILKIQKDHHNLLLYGTAHFNSAKNKEFKKLTEAFNEFAKISPKKETVVLIEKFTPPPMLRSPEEMLTKYGESGLIYYLGKKSGLKIICLEPDIKNVLKLASRVCEKEKVMAWILLNQIFWKTKKSNPIKGDDIASIKKTLEFINTLFKTKRSSADIYFILAKSINKSVKKDLLPIELADLGIKKLNTKLIKNTQDPFRRGTAINDAGVEINRSRDYLMFKAIEKEISPKKSLFVVMGANHVYCQKGAVKGMLAK